MRSTTGSKLPSAPESPAERSRPRALQVGLPLGIVAVIVAAAWVSQFIDATPAVRQVAAFVHLACVVIGFGSVLVVDWFGLRWRLGRCSLKTVVSVAGDLAILTWGGLAGLVLSGMVLQPSLESTMTQVKIGMVAGVGVVGVAAVSIQRRLQASAPYRPRGLVRRAVLVAAVSQVCWWGATVIGFLNRT